MKEKQPQWQPISRLPLFTEMIDEMLEGCLEQLRALKEAEEKPHVLDDETVTRTISVYGAQLNDHWLFEEQFARWKRTSLSEPEASEVDRLQRQATRLRATNEEILEIAHRLKETTIERIVAMDDLELGLKVLNGEIKPPR